MPSALQELAEAHRRLRARLADSGLTLHDLAISGDGTITVRLSFGDHPVTIYSGPLTGTVAFLADAMLATK